MRRLRAFVVLCLLAAGSPFAGAHPAAVPAQVVDRIVVRIEDDIIALSELRELAGYQQLVDGRAEPDERLIEELIEQWVIRNEAQVAQYPQPPETEVTRQLQHVRERFPSEQAFAQRLGALGLTSGALRGIVTRQIYLTSYIDYRFRPAVDVDEEAIARYYRETLAPALTAKQQEVPALETVTGQIREVLVSKAVSERVAAWLDETRSRLRIEMEPAAATIDSRSGGGDAKP